MGEVITAAKGAYEIYNLLQSAFPANDIIGKFRAEQAHKQEIQSIITAVDSAFAKLEEIDRSKAKDLIKEAASFWYDVVIPDILNNGLSKASIQNGLLDRIRFQIANEMNNVRGAVNLLGLTLTPHAENYNILLIGCKINFALHAVNELMHVTSTGRTLNPAASAEVQTAIDTNISALSTFAGRWSTYRAGLIRIREVMKAAEHHHHGRPPPPIHTGVHTVYQDIGDAWLGSMVGKRSDDSAYKRDTFDAHGVIMNYWSGFPSSRLFGDSVGVWISLKGKSNVSES